MAGAFVLGCLILATSFYLIQSDKSASIEMQQAAAQLEKEMDNARAELSMKQSECESLSVGVRAKWNNVVGVTYDDEFWEECVVTYTDTETGDIQTSPLRHMTDAN